MVPYERRAGAGTVLAGVDGLRVVRSHAAARPKGRACNCTARGGRHHDLQSGIELRGNARGRGGGQSHRRHRSDLDWPGLDCVLAIGGVIALAGVVIGRAHTRPRITPSCTLRLRCQLSAKTTRGQRQGVFRSCLPPIPSSCGRLTQLSLFGKLSATHGENEGASFQRKHPPR